MKLFFGLLLFISSSAFALDNCISYPILGDAPAEYKGTISEVSQNLSFGDCPESVLVNDRYVGRLILLADYEGETKCVYKIRSATFACNK